MSAEVTVAFVELPDAGGAVSLVDALRGSGIGVREEPLVRALDALRRRPTDALVVHGPSIGASMVDVVAHVRRASPVPLLVVADEAVELAMTRALVAGADDVVVAPIADHHLVARVRALVRRARRMRTTDDTWLEIDDRVAVDLDARTVYVEGAPVEVARREFDLLVYLVASAGRAVRHEELLRMVWRSSGDWQRVGTVTEHVRRLRSKIEVDPAHPSLLVTVRGIGYRFGKPAARPSGQTAPLVDLRERHLDAGVAVG